MDTKKVNVRKLMAYAPIEVRNRLRTNLTLVFEDGVEIPATYREIIMDRYIWGLLEKYPKIQITSEFHISKYYTNGNYQSSTFGAMFKAIYAHIVTEVMEPLNSRRELRPVSEKMISIMNSIYNDIGYDCLDYITNLNLKDFLEIQLDPRNVEAMRNIELNVSHNARENTKHVEHNYRVLHEIMTDGSYPKNKIVDGYNGKTMNPSQVQQILAARGVVTDINGNLFTKPIADSYTSGMYNAGAFVIESQTGAKSLKVSTTAVSQSEYVARKLQLVCARIERVIDGDCGQTDYEEWEVLPDSNNEDNPTKCHLPNLVGKYYYNPDTGKEEAITKDHTHLIGKKIKLRVAYKCKCIDKRCICTKCLGRMAYGIHDHTHLGHLCVTSVTEPISQGALSTKHQTSSANSSNIYINQPAKLDFEVKEGDNAHVYLKRRSYSVSPSGEKTYLFDNKKDFSLVLKFPNKAARGLADITPQTDVKRFAPNSVSSLYEMWLIKTNLNTGEVIEIPVEIRKAKKVSSFTTQFLEYIQKSGYTIDAEEDLSVSLDEWDFSLPVVIVPDVEFSYMNFLTNISKLFGASAMGTGAGRKKSTSGDDDSEDAISTQSGFLHRLFAELNSRLSINIANIEVIVAAFSVANYEEGDYGVGHAAPTTSTRNIKTIMHHSSCGGGYAFENHMDYMLNPSTFDLNNNVNHIMDVFICPKEALEDYRTDPLPQQ